MDDDDASALDVVIGYIGGGDGGVVVAAPASVALSDS